MRKFIRHPVDIPIEINLSEHTHNKTAPAKNFSVSGLCFKSQNCFEKDKTLVIKIPIINPNFEIQGKVVRCLRKKNHVEIGIEFLNLNDLHQIRMIEQICYIKQYQNDIAHSEGRELSDRQAAVEWIQKYAENFPK